MKKLRNNFTTPEQSRRLLELGVPVLTADCYFYIKEVNGRNICDTPNLVPYGMGEYGLKLWWTERNNARYTPCWSVGRLIEIICNCHVITNQLMENWICCDKNTNLIKLLVGDIEGYVSVQHMDFSKLEK